MQRSKKDLNKEIYKEIKAEKRQRLEIVYKNLKITDLERIYFGGFLPLKIEKRPLGRDPGNGRTRQSAKFKFSREIGKFSKKSFEIRQISPSHAVY